jgi:hypothetical protein
MVSIRARKKADGTPYWAVLYRLNGKQTSTSFGDFVEATQFREIANKHGIENALAVVEAQTKTKNAATGWTVEKWLTHHVDHPTESIRARSTSTGPTSATMSMRSSARSR